MTIILEIISMLINIHDAPPPGILMVVSLGVALGVFLGGVLLVCAARVVRKLVIVMNL